MASKVPQTAEPLGPWAALAPEAPGPQVALAPEAPGPHSENVEMCLMV